MLLCDAIHRDPTTGKSTILGTFSTVTAAEYPAKVQFSVYAALTDGLGPTVLRFRLVDARADIADDEANDGAVFEVAFPEIDIPNPLMVIEMASCVAINLPKAGLYHCEICIGESVLMSRRLIAVERDTKERG